ncbi:MFS transporter, CP family, cyanate transporter [Nocardioides terrae]|uniref:MFS transporter, CP family, cyanate transporter n=1 Tax=Nocardioides terrae TaxID=574651 RepID=A0A1I1ISK4_9ACTN|nr:MFS transporter [Nocardioides terrae]SFC38712.1 MFS transporter, CP family, cyanate transporter [Nocardioides terrae]
MTRRSSAVVLIAILLLAVNLRPTAVSVGPVLEEVEHGLHMGATMTGLLTSLPVLAFALFGSVAPLLARRFGIHRVTLLALFAVAIGLFARALADDEVVFLGLSMLALAGMALANVLLPSLVKLHFPDQVGRVTALYTTLLAVGLTLALTLTVPVSHAGGGWRTGLGVWALVAVVAAIPWLPMVAHDQSVDVGPHNVGFLEVVRTPIGVAMIFFFGLQSLQAYVVFGWFATLWRDAGFSAAEAGLLVGLLAAVSIPLSLWAPAALARSARPRSILLFFMLCYPVGYLALLIAPHGLAVPAALLIGTGAVTFPLVLVMINMRSRTPAGTAALSSVTQSLGYLIAGVGPFAIGLLHHRTDGWTWPLWVLIAVCVPQTIVGMLCSREVFVEDQLVRAVPRADEATQGR